MEIIIKPKIDDICTCDVCGCVFKFDSEDIYNSNLKTYDGTWYGSISTECPVCQTSIDITDKFKKTDVNIY